jgi:hypothetical protein
MQHPHQEDHTSTLQEELLAWFRTKPHINALVQALGTQLQELEDEYQALRDERLLSNATGAQLDQYGRIVGEPRGSLVDDDFRRFIQARILTNTSEGNADRLMAIFCIIAGEGVENTGGELRYIPKFPAGYLIQMGLQTPLTDPVKHRVAAQMGTVTPAGVEYTLVQSKWDNDGPFQFDSGSGFDLGELSELID